MNNTALPIPGRGVGSAAKSIARDSVSRLGVAILASTWLEVSVDPHSAGSETWLVDAEIPPDEPSLDTPCPENCRACIKACPTGAIAWVPVEEAAIRPEPLDREALVVEGGA